MLSPETIAALRDEYHTYISDDSKSVQGFRHRLTNIDQMTLSDLVREYKYWRRQLDDILSEQEDMRDEAYWAEIQAAHAEQREEELAREREYAEEEYESRWDEVADALEGVKPQHNVSLDLDW
jgi:predicted nuclease with TOPRIM domain